MVAKIAQVQLGRLTVLCMLCLILTGCQSKITKENFEQIKNDMTLEDVERLLGKGTELSGDASLVAAQVGIDVNAGGKGSSAEVYKWESDKKSITVTFRKGKVVHKTSTGLYSPTFSFRRFPWQSGAVLLLAVVLVPRLLRKVPFVEVRLCDHELTGEPGRPGDCRFLRR
jgi:hypothetical protein